MSENFASLRTSTFVMQFLCAFVALLAAGAGTFALHIGRNDLAVINGLLLFANVVLFFVQVVIRRRFAGHKH